MLRTRFSILGAAFILLIVAGACGGEPTAPTTTFSPRLDATGFGLGSGNKVDSTATNTATEGSEAATGFGLGSGN